MEPSFQAAFFCLARTLAFDVRPRAWCADRAVVLRHWVT